MVYVTQRIKVIAKGTDQRISIGEDQPVTPPPTPTTSPLNQLLQNLFPGYNPIPLPVPSTVSAGGIPDVVGPEGGGATGTGLGEGELVNVEVPSSAASGSTFLLKTTFKNKGTTTANFNLRILITQLSINSITPTISLTAGQQSIVESTIILPNVQTGGAFAGAVELRSITSSNAILFQDSEPFTLNVVGSGTTPTPAAAAITPSATTVQRGNSISINCINFGANEIIDFVAKVGATEVATDMKTTGANGATILNTLTFSTTAPEGSAVITATGRTSGKVATANVTVTAAPVTLTATIVPSATTVKQGEAVSIACSNFDPNELVHIIAKVGATTVATDDHTMNTAGSGVEPDLRFSLSSPLGAAIVTAKGFTSNKTATATVTVIAATPAPLAAIIVPSSTSVKQGQSVSVSCTNFAPNERIDFIAKVGTTTVATDNKTALSNGAVILDSLTFSLTSPTGTAVITATGATSGKSATANINVTPADAIPTPTVTVMTNKTTYVQNENVNITGSGFAAGEQVKAYITINAVEIAGAQTVTATSAGTFSAVVPASVVGSGHAHGKGVTSTRHAEKAITVVAATPTPTPVAAVIVPSATSVKQGASISIACTNFAANEVIGFVAKVGTVSVATDSKTALSNGAVVLDSLTFSTTSPLGTAVITATGGTSGKVATASVTVTAATTPTPTPTPAITLSATSVERGKAITVTATGFQAGEVVGIWATPNSSPSLTIAGANPVANSTGTAVATITFSTTAPTGTATVFALGRTSNRQAPTKSITVTSAPTPTPTTATITTNKSTYVRGEVISCSAAGLQPGEMAFFSLTVGGVEVSKGTDRAVSSTGTVSGTLNANGLGGGHAHVRGRTSGRHAEKGVTIVYPTISAPSSIHDGDTFTVTGSGFKGGEQVKTTVSGTWKSTDSSWNGKTFSASTTVTANSTGGFSVGVKTPEVPSGVSTTATIRSQGLTSLAVATRTISVI